MSRFVSMTMANQLAKHQQLSNEWLSNAIDLLEKMKYSVPNELESNEVGDRPPAHRGLRPGGKSEAS